MTSMTDSHRLAAQAQPEGLREEVSHLRHVIDRDRYIVATGIGAIIDQIRGRNWLLKDGRGNYEWDDERYKEEFGDAIDAIERALEPLRHVAWDKSDCENIEARVIAAKTAAADMLKLPLGPREMIRADLIPLSTIPQQEVESSNRRWVGVIELVERITREEGATVSFTGQNPDFNGLPNEAVTVLRGPEWKEETFRADTLAECLERALAEIEVGQEGEAS